MAILATMWIEFDPPKPQGAETFDEAGERYAKVYDRVLREKLGFDIGGKAVVWWHRDKACYCVTTEGSGSFLYTDMRNPGVRLPVTDQMLP